jgi:hypothetical protein
MKSRNVVAGVIHANCTCCAEPQELIHHVQLGPTRMLCMSTGRTYLDRGDGLYQPDGQSFALPPTEARGEINTTTDLLSDRPAKTADKTRISLERATFA